MKESPPELAALYRCAREAEEPSESDRAAVRGALSAALVATSITASAGAAPIGSAGLVKGLTFAKIAVVVGAGAVIGAATTAALVAADVATPAPSATTRELAPVRSTSPRPLAPGNDRGRASATTKELTPSPPERGFEKASAAATSAPRDEALHAVPSTLLPAPAVSSSGSFDGGASLASESAALALVQRALAANDGQRALSLLDEQDREYAHGALGEERLAARVFAWCAAADHERARATRDTFLRRYPRSPLGKRVLASCAGAITDIERSGHGRR